MNVSRAAHHGPDEGDVSPPGPEAPPGGDRQLSRPAELVVAVAAALCLTATVVHVAMVFLYVAPPNTVSRLYQKQINAWVDPYFEQDWRLFAPDPQSARQQVSARISTTGPDGTQRPGDWVDLTAIDDAAVRHDFFPSHTAQNMLRRAWAGYTEAQATDSQAPSPRALMLQEYLRNIALQRLAVHGRAAVSAVSAVQLRVTTTPIPPPAPPGGGNRQAEPVSSVRLLPWWQVTSRDH